MGFRNAGAKAGAPCSLAMRQGFPDLQGISFAASAECGRTERPWHAGRPHESCECFLELRFERDRGIGGGSRAARSMAIWPSMLASSLRFSLRFSRAIKARSG